MIRTYIVEGMHCGSCVARVEGALRALAPDAAVTLDPPRAQLTGQPRLTLPVLNDALGLAGAYKLALAAGATAAPANHLAPSDSADPLAPTVSGAGSGTLVAADPVLQRPFAAQPVRAASWFATYRPLLLIAAFITLGSLALNLRGVAGAAGAAGAAAVSGTALAFDAHGWMNDFMAGFFLVFSFFKLLDVPAFARAYAGYDLLAMRVPAYGTVYPFIELALGVAYLTRFAPTATNLITLALMTFSALGVLRALADNKTIQCACLGAVFKLPMSRVTLIEDGLMALMAAAMLAL